jgi:cytochrome c oxidase assembly protein subunit 15
MRLKTALFGVLLFLQSALVLTGGAVRLTGSGLGCPTWPECTPGSYTPVPHQEEKQLHAWIEFGNRLLTFALLLAALLVVLNILITRRKDLRLLAAGQVLGILGQGVLGGITVLTDLHPATVAAHLLLSMLLIAGATSLYSRRHTPTVKVSAPTKTISVLSRMHVIVSFIVLILGTLVTGSGPHAGDENSPRFDFDIRTVAWIHADAVIFLMGLTVAFLVAASLGQSTKKAIYIFLGISLAQGAIGYLQYFTGIPEILVAAHLLGATVFWIASWRVRLSVVRTPKEIEHKREEKR